MTATTHSIETVELNPALKQQLMMPRPDVEGIDAKTLAALTLFDFMAHSEEEKVSRDEFYKARQAATYLLGIHRAEISGLFSNISAADLELI